MLHRLGQTGCYRTVCHMSLIFVLPKQKLLWFGYDLHIILIHIYLKVFGLTIAVLIETIPLV